MCQLKKSHSCSITFTILVGVIGVNCVEYLTEKPSYSHLCRIYEPEFTKCNTESTQLLMTELGKGIPDITAKVGTLDPMTLDNIEFDQSDNPAASIKATLSNLKVTGFSNVVVKEAKVSKKDFSFETKSFVPKLRLEGNYKMSGKILLIPLNGAGKMFVEIEDASIVSRTTNKLYEKGGFTFFNVTGLRIDMDMKRVRCNFDNIFNGNSKEIERTTNEFFNENWREFYEALKPVIVESVEKVLLGITHEVFEYIPANFYIEDMPTSEKLYGSKS